MVKNDRLAIKAIKDMLQANLEDPREQYTATDRNWIHTDKPLTNATYPRIQVRRRGPSTTEIIDIGPKFMEWKSIVLDIQFWTSTPFKWKDTDNSIIQDEELVNEWMHKIWVTLKTQLSLLKNTYGITGLKDITEGDAYLEPDTDLYTGVVSVRIWYFTYATD